MKEATEAIDNLPRQSRNLIVELAREDDVHPAGGFGRIPGVPFEAARGSYGLELSSTEVKRWKVSTESKGDERHRQCGPPL
jgi:hypothetical protein